MIRVNRGDLLAIRAESGRYYYALILDKIGLFGGNWSFAFHKTAASLLTHNDVVAQNESGFHDYIDFIFAKREERMTRLATKVDVSRYDWIEFLRSSNKIPGRWYFIYNRAFEEVRRVERLGEEEKCYPI